MRAIAHDYTSRVSFKLPRYWYHLKRLSAPGCLAMSTGGRFWSVRNTALWVRSQYRGESMAAINQSVIDNSSRLSSQLDAKSLIEALRKEGAVSGLKLTDEDTKSLQAFADSHAIYGNRLKCNKFMQDERREAEERAGTAFQQAQYDNDELNAHPVIQRLSEDPLMADVVRNYFGHEGVLSATRLFWSYPVEGENYDPMLNSTHYHYDLDDYGCLRLFVYLSDVDEESGPHRYIKGSHRKKPLSQVLNASHALRKENELLSYYGEENEVTVVGEAGSAFIEDAMVFHEATRPKSKPRLLLQLTWVSKDFSLHSPEA